MCIDPEGYIMGSCDNMGFGCCLRVTRRNISIHNVYTNETTPIMNKDRSIHNLSFYRQGKKYVRILVSTVVYRFWPRAISPRSTTSSLSAHPSRLVP